MDTSKLFFVMFSLLVFVFIPFIIKDARRYFLALASFLHVFTSGWIFYHYTGLMLADLPVLGLFVYSLFSGRRLRIFLGPVMLPMLGIIVLGSLSAAWAKEPGWALAEASKYGRIYLLIVCLVHNIQSVRDLRLVLNSMLTGLLIEALIGVYQWKFGAVGIWFLGERAATWLVWRSTGTFFVPSYLANYLAMTVSVAFRMFIFYRPPKIQTTILYGAAGIVGFIALYTTYARGPWLSFLAAAAIVFLVSFINSKYKIKSSWGLPVLLLFVAVFAFRYHNQILDQFGTSRKTSYEMRFVHFQIAKRIIADRPLQGVGMGNYELNVRNYVNEEERAKNVAAVYYGMVHNSFLLFTAELGLPGGILFVLWFGSILIVIVQILRARMNHPLITNFTLGILGGIIAMIIFLLSSPDIHEYSLVYQAGLFFGILIAARNILRQASAGRSQNSMTVKGLSSGS